MKDGAASRGILICNQSNRGSDCMHSINATRQIALIYFLIIVTEFTLIKFLV